MVWVTQKKYFFDSITDWIRWNYLDGKVDYTEGENAFTLTELQAKITRQIVDTQNCSNIIAIGNTELWKKCKVIIWQDSDIIKGTVGLNWNCAITDNKPRFICNRCTPNPKLDSRYIMNNFNNVIDLVRVPLVFSEGENKNCCFGKSFLRNTTDSNLVLPNIDSNHCHGAGDFNVYRDNNSVQMKDIQIDCSSKANVPIEIGADYANPYFYKAWNIDKNCIIKLTGTDEEIRTKYRWIFNNGLEKVTSTRTLTIGSTLLAKLTDEDKKIATDKGWTLA